MEAETLINKLKKEKFLGGHPRFYELLLEIAKLHSDKNFNYAENTNPLSNLRECEKFGISAPMGVMVRLSDKWSRLQQLMGGKKDVVNESLYDTLRDMSIYTLLMIILLEEKNTTT